MNKNVHLRNKLNTVVQPYCRSEWCLLKEILCSTHTDDFVRQLVQLKVIEIFKLEQSEKIGKDIRWDGAGKLWISSSYAKIFSEVYSAELSPEEIYSQIKNIKPSF